MQQIAVPAPRADETRYRAGSNIWIDAAHGCEAVEGLRPARDRQSASRRDRGTRPADTAPPPLSVGSMATGRSSVDLCCCGVCLGTIHAAAAPRTPTIART